MNSTDFARAQTLLPSFLKKTISDIDKVWMTQFIQNLQENRSNFDEAKVRQFEDELAWIELSQSQLENATPRFDTEAGWKKLAMQITPSVEPVKNHDRKETTLKLLKSLFYAKFETLILFWRKPMVGVLASTMLVAQMGLLAALVRHTWQAERTGPETVVASATGDVKVKGQVLFSVMFKDTVKLQEIRTLLESTQGQIVSGPSAIGIWVIAVPHEKLVTSATAFKSSAIVESADQQ
jgi:hypothetical protein